MTPGGAAPQAENLGGRKLAQRALVVGIAVALAVDLGVTVVVTGVVAWLAMIAGVSAIGAQALPVLRRGRPGAPRIALLLALVTFTAARAATLLDQMSAPAAEAARSHDVIWAALAMASTISLRERGRILALAQRVAERPIAAFAGSFAVLIVIATLLLSLPMSVRRTEDVSLLDAFFTATSAVSVTGLAVNDVGTTYTLFGQVVLLAAIQCGGLGIMVLAALAVSMMTSAALRDQSRYAQMLDASSLGELRSMVRGLVLGTVLFEGLGALALWALWQGHPALKGHSVVWAAVFHSVSAFCNAGFSLFPTNLVKFSGDPLTQLVIMALIVIGGLGFPVWRGVVLHAARRARGLFKSSPPLPLHLDHGARVALATTAILVVTGAVAVAVLESAGALRSLGVGARLWNALFCSVTARTAGFNTIDYGLMGTAGLIVTMMFMFVGGSPGSTAGGIKTTTAAVIAAVLRGELRGDEPHLFGRAIAGQTLRRAVAVMTISSLVVVVGVIALSITERHPLAPIAFEAVSAFATTGLSTGITAGLSPAGKLILIILMFAGRVGPLTLALAVGRARVRARYHLARETVPIG